MDEHIIIMVLNADDDDGAENGIKPSTCYAEFCSKCSETIADETVRLIRAHSEHCVASAESTPTPTLAEAVAAKLKATYKNRLFLIKRSH
jgi:dihydroneopterin aldolase